MRSKLLATVLLLCGAAAVRAETIASDCVALGRQTELSSVVVVATVEDETARGDGTREARLRVDEPLRGAALAGATLRVVAADHGHGAPWKVGSRCLAFLQEAPGTTFRLVSGSFGIRAIPAEGPEARFPEIVRRIAATLDDKGDVKDAETLRTSLVGWLEDADPGIAWSAATDLVRRQELVAALTEAERVRIRAAYVRCPIGKTTKEALAFAVAAARPPRAAETLVATLVMPEARQVRGAVAEALRRLRDPETEALLDARLSAADAPSRRNLLVALGAVGGQGAVAAARRSLADDDAAVRAEAARALGLVARTVRDADAAARVEGREDLAHVVATAKSVDERRAALWALAQLNQPEAWAELRRAAADETLPEAARAEAARFLKAPRVSLILD
jgi:HEAT repeat protein